MESEDDDEESSPYALTPEILTKRLNKTNYGRINTQLYAAFVASWSAFTFGTALGWSCRVHLHMGEDATYSYRRSWLQGIMLLGCAVGYSSWLYAVKHMGPRKCLMLQAPFYTILWAVSNIRSMKLQTANRFFMGFVGISHVACTNRLLKDTIHMELFAYFELLLRVWLIVGVILIHVFDFYAPPALIVAVCAFMAALHFVYLVKLPESPVFLYPVNPKKAETALMWYIGPKNINLALRRIKKDSDFYRLEGDTHRDIKFSKAVLKALYIMIVCTFFQVFSGYYIILLSDLPTWYNGVYIIDEKLDSVYVGLYLCLSKIVWGVFHLKFRKHLRIRPLIILSCLMVAVCLSALAFLLALDDYHIYDLKSEGWTAVVVALLILFIDLGLNYCPNTMLYSYAPVQVRGWFEAMLGTCFYVFTFYNIHLFIYLKSQVCDHTQFICMALIQYAGAIFCYKKVVETKDQSLVKIQLALGANPIGTRGAY